MLKAPPIVRDFASHLAFQETFRQCRFAVGAPMQMHSVLLAYAFLAASRGYCDMKVEEIAEAVGKLPPDQLARFRRWFNEYQAGHTDHTEEFGSLATKLGRIAGRAFAEGARRNCDPRKTG
jgi:hypothetical protein